MNSVHRHQFELFLKKRLSSEREKEIVELRRAIQENSRSTLGALAEHSQRTSDRESASNALAKRHSELWLVHCGRSNWKNESAARRKFQTHSNAALLNRQKRLNLIWFNFFSSSFRQTRAFGLSERVRGCGVEMQSGGFAAFSFSERESAVDSPQACCLPFSLTSRFFLEHLPSTTISDFKAVNLKFFYTTIPFFTKKRPFFIFLIRSSIGPLQSEQLWSRSGNAKLDLRSSPLYRTR